MATPADSHSDEVEVSFLIPCLNEAESLAHVIDEIRRSYQESPYRFEILVADNGSTDGSQGIALSLGARVVDVPARGYGAALLGGIAASEGSIVVMGDADGSYRFADALPMISAIREGADVVMGNRFSGGISKGAMPLLHRYLGNPVLSMLGRLFFGIPAGDFHSGLRAFNRDRIRALGLTAPGMEFASEMLVRAQKAGYKIEEVPVTLGPDLRSRPPHLRTWRDGWRHLRFLMFHSPRWTFLIPACIVGVLSLFILMVTVVGPVSVAGVEFSYRTSIVAAALAWVAASAGWAAFLARTMLSETRGRGPAVELMATLSTLVALVGLGIIVSQLIAWQGVDFGSQPGGQNLLLTVAGGFCLGLGGLSFFFSLLTGVARNSR